MTPEERAAKVVDELDEAFHGERAGIIAEAIKMAENDALERAAKTVDGEDPFAEHDATAIRALKHK